MTVLNPLPTPQSLILRVTKPTSKTPSERNRLQAADFAPNGDAMQMLSTHSAAASHKPSMFVTRAPALCGAGALSSTFSYHGHTGPPELALRSPCGALSSPRLARLTENHSCQAALAQLLHPRGTRRSRDDGALNAWQTSPGSLRPTRLLRPSWAEARIKITRMTLTIKLDRKWSSFQLANSAPPLSVTGSAIAPSARMSSSACL